jgi:peptidoglycan/xylan/chitin deacetylase (PgdA/CDA1 family)
VRNLEYFHGIDRAGGVPRPRPVRVLCYHAVADLRGARVLEPYGVPPAEFRRQLRHLVRHYRPIDVAEFRRFLSGAGVPRRAVLVTFDDCYADIVDVALPALRERGVPALAFAVTRLVGKTNEWDAHLGAPELRLADADGLRALADERIAIGSHARTHRMLNTLAHDELGEELRESREDIEHLGLPRPDFLAYPHGEHSADVRTAARDAGYAGAFTVTPGLAVPGSDPYTIPRLEIRRADAGWRFAWKLARGR